VLHESSWHTADNQCLKNVSQLTQTSIQYTFYNIWLKTSMQTCRRYQLIIPGPFRHWPAWHWSEIPSFCVTWKPSELSHTALHFKKRTTWAAGKMNTLWRSLALLSEAWKQTPRGQSKQIWEMARTPAVNHVMASTFLLPKNPNKRALFHT